MERHVSSHGRVAMLAKERWQVRRNILSLSRRKHEDQAASEILDSTLYILLLYIYLICSCFIHLQYDSNDVPVPPLMLFFRPVMLGCPHLTLSRTMPKVVN